MALKLKDSICQTIKQTACTVIYLTIDKAKLQAKAFTNSQFYHVSTKTYRRLLQTSKMKFFAKY